MRDLHLCRYISVLCGYQKWQIDLRAKQFDPRVYGFYVYFLVFFELGFLGFIRKPRFVFQGLEFHTYYLWGCVQRSAFICAGAFQCCAQVLENGKFNLGTICSQKVRESVPMYNYCHSENQNWRKEPPRNLQFFHENNTINSFEFPEIPKSGGFFFFHFDWFDWSGNFISINRTLKLQDQNICIRKEMKRDIRIIQKVTLSSPCLLACFHPLSPLSVCPQSNEILFKSQYEMLKLSIECTRFESNYNSWKKERPNETQFTTKIGGKTSLCPSYFIL
jgi:hypothetical protein